MSSLLLDEAAHTFSLVARDKPGVLVRIALVFARRGFNIESLAVSPGAIEGFARMTITSRGAPDVLEQIIRQLAKLVDVVHVTDHSDDDALETEVAFIKLRCDGATQANDRARALEIGVAHGAQVVDERDGRLVLFAHGESKALDRLIHALASCEVEELVRSGKIVIDPGVSPFSNLLGRAS